MNSTTTPPWWRTVDEAAQLIASTVTAAVTHAARHGTYTAPPGAPQPRRRREPASLRHLAEVIRTHRLAPGASVDKDVIAGVLAGNPRYVSDDLVVVAVTRAAHLIARAPFGELDEKRLAVACEHVTVLIEAAREADRRTFDLVPVRPKAPAPAPARLRVAVIAGEVPAGGSRRLGVLAAGVCAATAVGILVQELVVRVSGWAF